jgi:hypothetical protein
MSPLLYYFYDLQRDNTLGAVAVGEGGVPTPIMPPIIPSVATRYFAYIIVNEETVVVGTATRYFAYPSLPPETIRHNAYPTLTTLATRHNAYLTVTGT